MKRKNNLTIITLTILLALVIEATYAYFIAQKGEGVSSGVQIGAGTTDSLAFRVGDYINLLATTQDFYQGGEDKVGTTTATAELIPNNVTNEAHEKYNVYFIIDANDFIYTTETEEPEILLKVKNPEGNYISHIESLEYNEQLGGFDITRQAGIFKISLHDDIIAIGQSKTETWTVEVILRNLSTNQRLNGGHSFSGKVLITPEEIEEYIKPEIYSITTVNKDYESISIKLLENENHTAEIKKYYYAIEETDEEPETASIMSIAERLSPNYIEASEPTYTFRELDGAPLKDNQSYKIYAYEEDVNGILSNIKTAIIKTDEYKRVQVLSFLVEDKTTTSIKVKALTKDGTKKVKDYAFMIENNDKYGTWSEWQTSDTFEFTGLVDTHTYNIKVKVRDELDRESVDSYDRDVQTEEYVYPSVKTFTVSDITSSTLRINCTFEDGTGTVSKVAYQRNDDSNWYSATNSEGTYSYLFTNLEKLTTYTFKIKVTDSNNREIILEKDIYKGITLNNHLVKVEITGGTSTPPEATVDTGKDFSFAISASPGYDISTAKATGINCDLSEDKKTLTASNVIADRTCKVTLDLEGIPLHEFIISKVDSSVGDGVLLYHKSGLIGGLDDSAKDNSYRYSGNNPNNYVCFGAGSEAYNNGGTTCPDTNLYRIIGVFDDQVKLIKSEYITSAELGIPSDGTPKTGNYDSLKRVKVAPSNGFKWNQTDDNTWENSTLYKALNNGTSGYLSKLGTTWTNKIATTTWHVGGTITELVTPKVMYDAEIKSIPTVSAQIGLMYVSDYGFASEQKSWPSTLRNYNNNGNNNLENNWLFNNIEEWTISRTVAADGTVGCAFHVQKTGIVYSSHVDWLWFGVRPTFYLNSDVRTKVDDRDGSVSKPFRIAV